MTAAHEHTWVNTATGVLCTSCKETIDAPPCEHSYVFDRIEDTGQSVRKIHMTCSVCGHDRAVLTTKSDAQIMAEVEAGKGA